MKDHVLNEYSPATKLVVCLLLSTELQCCVTLTGRRTGVVFGLKNTMIMALIKDTIVDLFPGIGVLQIQNAIQAYLKRGSDRKGGLSRDEKRRLDVMQHD